MGDQPRESVPARTMVLIVVAFLIILLAASYLTQIGMGGRSSTSSSSSSSSTAKSSVSETSSLHTSTTTTSSSVSAVTPVPSNSTQLIDDSWTSAYDSLDPQIGFSTVDGFFANVFQGLVQFNGSDSNHVVPAIASNWSVSSDFKTWTFSIRPGVTFSNGDPVNAFTGWFSFQRGYILNAPPGTYVDNYPNLLENISNPCTGSPSSPTSCVGEEGNSHTPANQMIWGTRAAVASAFGIDVSNDNVVIPSFLSVLDHFNPSNATQLAIMENPNQGVYVKNTNTLVIHLLQSYPSLLIVLPPQWGAFVDPTFVDSPTDAGGCGGVVNNTACESFGTEGGPGTGPYEFSTIGPSNNFVVLKANPNYWAKSYNWSNGTPSVLCLRGEVCQPVLEPPKISTITMNFVIPQSAIVSGFGSNEVQLGYVDVSDFGQLISSYNYSGFGFSQLFRNLGYPLCDLAMGLNGEKFPTNITDFRLAIVHAVNYSAMVSQLYTYDGYQLSAVFQPPAPPGFGPLDNPHNISLYSYNPTLAAQYLNKSGWEGNFYTFTTARIGDLPDNATLGNPHGQRLGSITYQYPVPLTPDQQTIDTIIGDGLATIGIQVTFSGITTVGVEYTGPPNFLYFPQIDGVGWCADFPDPIFQQFIPLAVPDVAYELSASVSNSTLLTLLQRIPFETNLAQQLYDAGKAWEMYSQLAGIIQNPLPENYVFAQPYIQGIVYSPFEFGYYYNMMYYQNPK